MKLANAKKRYLLINKCSISFSNKLKNLSEQADYYNNKHKDMVMEVVSIPSLDNTMYPKLKLATRKK